MGKIPMDRDITHKILMDKRGIGMGINRPILILSNLLIKTPALSRGIQSLKGMPIQNNDLFLLKTFMEMKRMKMIRHLLTRNSQNTIKTILPLRDF